MNQRRKLIVALGACWLTAPIGSVAQQQGKVWRVGYLALTSGEDVAPGMVAFKERLRELDYVEGKNLLFEYQSAEERQGRLAELATALTRSRPDVLIAGLGTLVPLALKRVTTTIPIVFTAVGDPVGAGVVANLARPGGNITGLTSLAAGIAGKRLQLLRAFVPKSQSVAVLMNPATPYALLAVTEMRAAAEVLSIRLEILELKSGDQVANRFETAIKAGTSGMIVVEDPVTYSIRQHIIDLAAKYKLPTIYGYRDIVEAGGLISYGADRREMYRRAAEYVDKILKGAKPAELPVEQPRKFELFINGRTAKALGLTIPQSLLISADKVIE